MEPEPPRVIPFPCDQPLIGGGFCPEQSPLMLMNPMLVDRVEQR